MLGCGTLADHHDQTNNMNIQTDGGREREDDRDHLGQIEQADLFL